MEEEAQGLIEKLPGKAQALTFQVRGVLGNAVLDTGPSATDRHRKLTIVDMSLQHLLDIFDIYCLLSSTTCPSVLSNNSY